MTLLEIQNLQAGYGSDMILKGISFRLEEGTLTGILGINGCGKTTLMKAICGILPSKGEIRLLGKDAKKLSSREMARFCRYIPQRTGITLDISVLDVVLMGFNPRLGLLEYPGIAMRQTAMAALASVGLEKRAESNFQTLSEGQKQLCLLARAMLLEQGVLLLDEPESALDFSGRYKMLGLISQWLSSTGSCGLVTLHDPQLAINTCDTLFLFKDGRLEGTLHPGTDSQEQMQLKLSHIYGSLSIHKCFTRGGKAQFVLLKEE